MKKIILCLCFLSLIGCKSKNYGETNVVEEVTELKTKLDSGKIVVVDFWAPWCGPCRALSPTYKTWAAKHPEAIFVKVNIDESPDLATQYNISYIPQVHVMKKDKVVKLIELSEAKLIEAIKSLQ